MPQIDNLFDRQSKYLKASHFQDDGPQNLTIKSIKQEELGQGKDAEVKPVLYFQEREQGLVLNVTNGNIIKRLLGTGDVDDWPGQAVQLYATETEFKGDMVPCIRVRKAGKIPDESEDLPL